MNRWLFLSKNKKYWAGMMLGSCLASGGCTHPREYWRNKMKVGPQYERPIELVSNEWIDEGSPKVQSKLKQDVRWWEEFDDPILASLIDSAYLENYKLKDAGFRVLAARATYNVKVGQLLPQSQTWDTGYDRLNISPNVGFATLLPQKAFSLWSTGFNLTWEFDVWGKFRRNIETASGQYQASVEDYDGVLLTLISDLANFYIDYRTGQAQVASIKKYVEIMRGSLQIAEERFKGGATSEVDVEQAKLNLAQTQAQLPPNEERVRKAGNAICVLLGIPPEDLAKRLGEKPIPTPPKEAKVGIPADLVRRRPDVRKAERELAAQCAQIGVAEAELYPSFAVNGYLGLWSSEIDSWFTPNSFFGRVGPAVDWKILNYGRLLNNIRVQDAKFQSLGAAYQQTVLNAGREAEDGMIEYIKAEEAALLQAKAVEAANKSVALAKIQYIEGSVDFNRVYVLEREAIQEIIKLNDNLGSYAHGIVHLYKAIGGGWEMRLQEPALSDMENRPSPREQGGNPDDYDSKPRPEGFGYWKEVFKGHKPP
jgi:NodT family efflux transporter outer membrane factor (OMF) lipoprotein